MPIAKHLIVENGVLNVTDKPKPGQICKMCSHADILAVCDCEKAKQSWKQSALVVGNTAEFLDKLNHGQLYNFISNLIDDIYDAPVGLEYEVQYQILDTIDGPFKPTHKPMYDRFPSDQRKQVAILSFASPKEEASKEKPDFEKMLAVAHREWGQCIEKIAALQEEIRQLKEHSEEAFKMVERTIVSGNYDTTTGENLELLSIHLRKLKNKQ